MFQLLQKVQSLYPLLGRQESCYRTVIAPPIGTPSISNWGDLDLAHYAAADPGFRGRVGHRRRMRGGGGGGGGGGGEGYPSS